MPKQRSGDGWSFRPAHIDVPARPNVSLPRAEQRFVIELDSRKRGKTVTAVRGLVLSPDDLKALAKALKAACGSGGTSKSGIIELQGDCRERAGSWLVENGWGVQ